MKANEDKEFRIEGGYYDSLFWHVGVITGKSSFPRAEMGDEIGFRLFRVRLTLCTLTDALAELPKVSRLTF